MIKYSSIKPKQEFTPNVYKGDLKRINFTISESDYNRLIQRAAREGFSAYGAVKALVQNYINED